MSKVSSLVLAVALLLAISASAATPVKVGSVAAARFSSDWTFDAVYMENTRAKLLNPLNFGNSGTVRRAIQITDTASTVGSVNAALLSGFDVFFIGYLFDGSANAFTPAEVAAFQAWVAAGGTMIVTCDDQAYEAICSAFGYPVADAAVYPAAPAAEAADHPLFKGPFGDISQLDMAGSRSVFGDTTGATVLARDSSGLPGMPVMLLRHWGRGRVILLGDVDLIAFTLSTGNAIVNDNDRLLGNLFAYVIKPYDLMIDAAAHTGGLNGSSWRSDVDLLNVGSSGASVSVAQLKANQPNLAPLASVFNVPARGALRLEDLLGGLFTGSNAAFGLSFSGGQVYANSRFYNVGSADGVVYGMYIPSTEDRGTVVYGRPGAFHHLSYTPGSSVGTRVNIGGASRVPFPAMVVIRLFGDAGDLLGTMSHTFQPYEHRQFTKIHESLAAPAVTHGYATVEMATPGGAVDMYAMLIENESGDPIFMPPSFGNGASGDAALASTGPGGAASATEVAATAGACAGPYQRIVAAAANNTGVNDTKWQSDVDLLNLGADVATVDVARLKANQSNAVPLVAGVAVPAGQTLRLTNVLATLLPAGNAGLGFRFCSGDVLVNSRFYNSGSADGKVYGMYVPSMAPDQTVTPCRPAVFHHLSYSTDSTVGQRVNIGATNASSIITTWVIKLYGDAGELLGTQTATLQPYEHHQYTNIHRILRTAAVAHGWATVEVTTAGGAIHPYAMRIENVGGDPVYMPAQLENLSTTPDVAAAFAGSWTGGWVNSTFATSGSAAMTLAFDLDAQSVQATMDLGGPVFGGADPPAQTLTGTITDDGIVFKGTSAALGTYDVTISGTCSISGRLSDLPGGFIDHVDLAGTMTTAGAVINYTIQFTPDGGDGTAAGTLTMAK